MTNLKRAAFLALCCASFHAAAQVANDSPAAMPFVWHIDSKKIEVMASVLPGDGIRISRADALKLGADPSKIGSTVDVYGVEIDTSLLEISGPLPADILPPYSISRRGRIDAERLKAETGAWVNFFADASNRGSALLADATVSLGGNSGVLRYTHSSKTGRIFAAWEKNDAASLRTTSIGNFYASSLGLAAGRKMVGLQARKNFSLDPNYVYYPTLDIKGSASAPSTFELFEGTKKVLSGELRGGEFSISDYSSIVGRGGAVKMVVRDANGLEQVIERPLYTAPGMLKAGESSWSLDVGSDDEHGKAFISGSYRLGFDRFTAEGAIEVGDDTSAAAAGIVLPIDLVTVAGRAASGKLFGEKKKRLSLSLDRDFYVGGYDFHAFVQSDKIDGKRATNAGLSVSKENTSALFSFSKADGKTSPLLSVSHSIKNVTFTATALRSDGKTKFFVGANFPIFAGSAGAANAWFNGGSGRTSAGAYGVSGDLRWQASASNDSSAAQVNYKTRHGDFDVRASRSSGKSYSNLRYAGALFYSKGDFALTRPIHGAAVIVETGARIPVRASGRAESAFLGESATLVASASAYSAQTLQLDLDAVDAGYTSERESAAVVPPAGVSRVKMPVREPGFFVEVFFSGEKLSRGEPLSVDGQPALVTSAGIYVQPRAGQRTVAVSARGCAAEVQVPTEPLAHVRAELECEAKNGKNPRK